MLICYPPPRSSIYPVRFPPVGTLPETLIYRLLRLVTLESKCSFALLLSAAICFRMPKPIKFRVSFTDREGAIKRVRLPALYALALVRSNIARRVSGTEVLLYRGYCLRINAREQTFSLESSAPIPLVLCRDLRRMGLHWEASHLAGKVASQSFHRMSLTPYMDAADFQDRHLLLAGSLA